MDNLTRSETGQADLAAEEMLAVLLAAEDQAEDAGQLDADRRVTCHTCHTCRTWATTAHINDPGHWGAIKRAARRRTWITVSDPADPTDSMFIYDGPAHAAGQHLAPGTYDATDDEGRRRVLTIAEEGTASVASPVETATAS